MHVQELHLCVHMWWLEVVSASVFLHLVLCTGLSLILEILSLLDCLAHKPQGFACLYISALTSPSNHLPSPVIINKL